MFDKEQVLQVVQLIAQAVAEQIRNGPPKNFTLHRTDPSGATYNEVKNLPQLTAEMCDELRASRTAMQDLAKSTAALARANGKLAKIIEERII